MYARKGAAGPLTYERTIRDVSRKSLALTEINWGLAGTKITPMFPTLPAFILGSFFDCPRQPVRAGSR
jgi:hypothetical protein